MNINLEKNNTTIGQELCMLLGETWKSNEQLAWPPDIFAICAWLLEASGGYVNVIGQWPPQDDLATWKNRIATNAALLRKNAVSVLNNKSAIIPEDVTYLWSLIVTKENTLLAQVSNEIDICHALLELIAMADEACVGFGLPLLDDTVDRDEEIDDLLIDIQAKLQDWETLTPRFATTRLYTLPKQHTPRFGITLRSLSHHLALFTGGEVVPTWSVQPEPRGSRLNILVIPWPFNVKPSQFTEASCPNLEQADSYKCFDYQLKSAKELLTSSRFPVFENWLRELFDEAKKTSGEVHGVIFPESSLCPEDFYILEKVAHDARAFVVAGVAYTELDKSLNEVWMTFGEDEGRLERKIKQGKHHRWQIDKRQIEMYGLGGSLDPNFKWWENTAVQSRDVNFVAMHGLLTICCLICEDLARQDPVSRLVRAVGPNLVIALLSDGPQIEKRWPARYATVLADDPGSSVLTVTSLGMAQLATPPKGESKSRAIALWKDAQGGLREIALDQGASAVLLNLWTYTETEFTADGRGDGGVAAYPALAGCHQIFIE